jgi:hypothetical protein
MGPREKFDVRKGDMVVLTPTSVMEGHFTYINEEPSTSTGSLRWKCEDPAVVLDVLVKNENTWIKLLLSTAKIGWCMAYEVEVVRRRE